MIDLNKVNEVLQQINEMQERLDSCKDDRQAILIQTELVELLKETFQDEELLTALVLSGKTPPT